MRRGADIGDTPGSPYNKIIRKNAADRFQKKWSAAFLCIPSCVLREGIGVTVEVDDFIFTAAVSFHDIAALAIAAVSDQNGTDHQNDDQDNRDNADCKQNFTDV